MFAVSNLLVSLANLIGAILTIYYWLIIIRALIGWVNPDQFNPIVQFLYKATDPVLDPVRRILPFSLKHGIDISPIIVFLIIMFLRDFLVRTILDLALRLKVGG